MDNEREKIIKKIHDTPIEDINKDKSSKKSKMEIVKEVIKELLLSPLRFVGAILGVTEENISISNRPAGHGAHSGGHNHSHASSGGSTYRESVSFDPSKAYMERIQEQAYFKMVDGKGDPEHCDCDHDR